MSLGYYCYLVVERNHLNYLRHRQYRRLYKGIDKLSNGCGSKYYSVIGAVRNALQPDNIEYLQKNLEFRDKIVAKMKENHKILKEAGLACDLKPYYDGANKIQYLQAIKPTPIPTLHGSVYKNHRKEHNLETIERMAKDYIAECTLLGITIENPYALDDECL